MVPQRKWAMARQDFPSRQAPGGDAPTGLTPLAEPYRRQLRELAWQSIRVGLDTGRPLRLKGEDYPHPLWEAGATFVTIEKDGLLRGCVGTLFPWRPLVEDVVNNAFSAAFKDWRFPPLKRQELPLLDLHISRLTRPEPLEVSTREDLLRRLVPGEDGLLVEDGWNRATFLPQVWTSLPDPEKFLSHLLKKAGLPARHWSASLRVYRYRVEEF